MGTASTFFSTVDRLVERLFLLDLESNDIWTVSPKNLIVWFLMKCMGWSWQCSFGSYIFAVDTQRARMWHLGTLAFIPLQCNHLSMPFSNLLQLSGPSLIRQVSSAYWRRWMVLSSPSLMRQVSSVYWRRWMVLSGPSLMRQVSSAYWRRLIVLSGPSLMRQASLHTGEGGWFLRSITDEAGIICVLEKVDGS